MATSSGTKPGVTTSPNVSSTPAPAKPSPKTKRPLGALATTVGKKLVAAATGLALCLFLVGHLAGNLLLLFPGEQGQAFNRYATTLNSLPFLLAIELGLVAMFLLHAWQGFMIWRENKAARGEQGYYYKTWARTKSDRSRKTVSSTTMMVSGIVILLFTAMHIWHFKYHHSIGPANWVSAHKSGEAADYIGATPSQAQNESKAETKQDLMQLAQHVVLELKKPYVTLLYIICMIALGMHLYHAVSSSFQSLGVDHGKITWGLMWFGRAFTVAIAGGFILLPLWAWFVAEVPRDTSSQGTQSTLTAPARH